MKTKMIAVLFLAGVIFLARFSVNAQTGTQRENVFVSLQACTPPPEGLIAWWPGDGHANDIHGGRHGAMQNGAAFTAGNVGQAFGFDGVDDYVEVTDSDLWAFGSDEFTIGFWANFNTVPGGTMGNPDVVFIANDEGAGTTDKWGFILGGNTLTFHINGPGLPSVFLAQATFTPVIHQWYHFTVKRTGNTFAIFVDGTPVGSEGNSIVIPNPDAPLTIGQAENFFTDGLMDEVSIWDRALSDAEILGMYNAGGGGMCKSNTFTIGGFDVARGGIGSLPSGSAFEDARASLAIEYPVASYSAVGVLTQPAVAGMDIIVLSPVWDGFNPISPLSAGEQNVLLEFVKAGGCAVLLPENEDFSPANESLLDPFGMDISGMVWGWADVVVAAPQSSIITAGRFGAVGSFSQGWAGSITNLGPFGKSLAANISGEALAVIPRGALDPDSGLVVVFSDTTTFLDAADGGGFSSSRGLFLNVIQACLSHYENFLPAMQR